MLLSCQLGLDHDNIVTEQSYKHHQVLGHVVYKETKKLGLFCPRKRRLWGELIAACSYPTGRCKDDKEQRHTHLRRCPGKQQVGTHTSCTKGKIQLDVGGKFNAALSDMI